MGTLYSEIPSWMHRLPAGLKLLLLALSSMALLALSDLRIQALAFAAIAFLYASLGAGSRPTRRLVVVAVIASALVGGLHAAIRPRPADRQNGWLPSASRPASSC
jgi:biotin transport system permease protein